MFLTMELPASGRLTLSKVTMNQAEALQVFDGALLGDAGLYKPSKNAYFAINLSGGNHVDWLQSLKEALLVLGVEVKPNLPKVVQACGVEECCRLWSSYSEALTLQHSRWYIGRSKIVPADLTLSPVVLANWFMGDGSSSLESGIARFQLATQNFSLSDVKRLQYLLFKSLNILTFRKKYRSGFALRTNDYHSSMAFHGAVGALVLPSYNYRAKCSMPPKGEHRRAQSLRTFSRQFQNEGE